MTLDVEGQVNFYPKFRSFVETEAQLQRFQAAVHELTSQCWDICVEKTSNRLDSKTENCLTNCVDRFLDTTQFIVSRLEKTSGLNSSFE